MKKLMKKTVAIVMILAIMSALGCSKFKGKSEERKTDVSWSVTASELSKTLENTFTVKSGQNLRFDIDVMKGKVTVKVEDSNTHDIYVEVEVSESTTKEIKCEGKIKVTYKFSGFDGNVSAKVDGKVTE